MVSAGVFALALVLAPAGPAAASIASTTADSSALESWEREDAVEESPEEAAFFGGEAEAAAPHSDGARAWSRGRAVSAAGGRSILVAVGARGWRGKLLLAREAGEPRAVDDRYAALSWRPSAQTRLRLGWVEPRVGAGLVLGPRRVTTSPTMAPRAALPLFAAPLSALPARAAAGWRGLAAERAMGPWRLGALAAWTPREARPSGAALRPLLGVRHRHAGEEAHRGRLDERLLALAALYARPDGRLRAWGVGLASRTDPRRAPYEGSSAAAESAATIGVGGRGGEVGAVWAGRGPAAPGLELAVAWDAGGRARARFAASAAAEAATRASLVVATEARGFVPPRALPERRPRADVALRLERRGRRPWRLEAHATDRGVLARPRLWLALTATPGRLVRLEARHDGEPRRTRGAVRIEGRAGPAVRWAAGAEARFDAAGLARRTGWIAVTTALPTGWRLGAETRLAGGRSAVVWIDDDVSGGRLVRPGPGAARTRLELARRGAVGPRLSWARTTTPLGDSDEVRVEVHWVVGPFLGPPD